MGVRMTGLASGISPQLVEQLVQAERIPVETAKKRKNDISEERKAVQQLQSYLNELGSAINGLRTKGDFFKLKVDSSHPDIVDGTVQSLALPGTYEFEVRGLAKSEKELAYGFPDKDQTPVGFGYMLVERDDKEPIEITVEPGASLQDVANQINDADQGVRAIIVNTKYKPDAYRLLVISEESGNEAKITIDEDTTFLEFKEQVSGRNLDVLFEDVPITDEDNNLDELIDGVVFNIKRSEPGTRVQVNVVHDLDKTVEGIKAFIDKYNQVAGFVHKQFIVDDKTKRAGILAADSSIKTVMRQLQGTMGQAVNSGGKYTNLSAIGITTNPKTGELAMDEAKVKQALAEDYEGVARLFVRSRGLPGLADRLGEALKGVNDPGSGVVKSRLRGLDSIIKNQDEEIERRERQLEGREAALRRRFQTLETQMANMQAQGQAMAARFGGEAPGGIGGMATVTAQQKQAGGPSGAGG